MLGFRCTQQDLLEVHVLGTDVAGHEAPECKGQQAACHYLAAILIRLGRCCFVCELGLLLPHLGHHSSLHQSSGLLMWQEGERGGGEGGKVGQEGGWR